MILGRPVLGLSPTLSRTVLHPRLLPQLTSLRSAINASRPRAIQLESVSPSKGHEILNKQRLNRPSSPHFTIYQPQLTWLGSIANRVTGAGLGVLLYGFSLAYLVAPTTFDSAHVVDLVSTLPESLKIAAKSALALSFSFHALNGLRHLSWDMGRFLTVRGAYLSGYAVLGATCVSTVYLVFMQ